MVWSLETSCGDETRKIRPRALKYCQGIGLDIGPGDDKICHNALGVGLGGKACLMNVDLSAPDHLDVFSSNYMDFVYSSHALEDLQDTEGTLKEWWRVIAPGGYLILYLPHEDLYPRVGEPGANPRHKHDFNPDKIIEIMERIGTYQIFENEVRGQDDEYSFFLVFRKLPGIPWQVASEPKKPMKKACVVRYGGFGDCLMASVVLEELKRQGYHTVFNTVEKGRQALFNDPSVDEFFMQFKDQVPPQHLDDYWERLAKEYDLFINLSQTSEKKLLFRGPMKKPGDLGYRLGESEISDRMYAEGNWGPIDKEFSLPHAERHAIADRNYMDVMLESAGMPHLIGSVPVFRFSESESRNGAFFRNRFNGKFLVTLVVGGSANHKHWVHSEALCRMILESYPEAQIVTMGEPIFRLWEFDHPRVTKRCGLLGFRESCIIASVSDLVITPETGLAWAMAGLQVPKIVLLSHSSQNNLTRDWINTVSVEPPVSCHPCHQLHYRIEDCPTDGISEMSQSKGWVDRYPVCVTRLKPETVFEHVEEVYFGWKMNSGERSHRKELAHA